MNISALHLTHPSAHTHTHNEHTPREVGSHIAAAPGEQLGVWCHAQGPHPSHGIEGGRECWYSQLNQNGLIIETV